MLRLFPPPKPPVQLTRIARQNISKIQSVYRFFLVKVIT